jgi:uncharacterized protein YecA (UPF0149 family)
MTILDGLKRLLAGPEQQPIPVLGRNEQCWCGSGKKYKACHIATDDRKRMAQRSATGRTPQKGMF